MWHRRETAVTVLLEAILTLLAFTDGNQGSEREWMPKLTYLDQHWGDLHHTIQRYMPAGEMPDVTAALCPCSLFSFGWIRCFCMPPFYRVTYPWRARVMHFSSLDLKRTIYGSIRILWLAGTLVSEMGIRSALPTPTFLSPLSWPLNVELFLLRMLYGYFVIQEESLNEAFLR
jgi:hypothetical protein